MAENKDTTQNSSNQNQTMRAEQAKAEVSGKSHDEKAKLDKERQEKGAIGGSHPADKPEEFKKNPEPVQPR